MFSMRSGASQPYDAGSGGPGFNPFRFFRRVVVLAFALIQGVLIARILLDIGIIPAESAFGTFIIVWSDTLAAPVQGLGNTFGGLFGGPAPLPGGLPPGLPGIPGMPGIPGPEAVAVDTGLNPVMIAALAGWTVVEWLVMRFVNKLQQV